jgi:23S rRNA (uracil1939-C5)-methyltransferase
VISPIIGSEDQFLYRNKLEYTFSSKRWLTDDEINEAGEVRQLNALGFHIMGYFDKVLDIRQCHLQPEPTNAIRNAVREYSEKKKLDYFNHRDFSGFLRNLIIRTGSDGQVMVVVVFNHPDKNEIVELLDFIISSFPGITSLMYVINKKRNDSIADLDVIPYYGQDHLIENVDGLKFRIGPKSFFQTNLKQSVSMYRIVKEYASLTGEETVYDLYTGTGTIANYVAAGAKKVIGVEYVDEAVKDAEMNSSLNNISNTSFYSGDLKDILTPSFIETAGRPDVIITDPPRSGMHPGVIKSIIGCKPKRIVYVSCNPATQARDLSMLSEHYTVKKVQPLDMFPQTPHVENLVLLDPR